MNEMETMMKPRLLQRIRCRLLARRASADRMPRVLAVASGGGHWVQLLRLRPAFNGADVAFVTVQRSYEEQVGEARFYTVNEASRWNKFALLLQALRMARIILRERPDVIITTGAAPGYFAVVIGKVFGARTMWIDSIANAAHPSLSCAKVSVHADTCLTQWAHVAASEPSVSYQGAVV